MEPKSWVARLFNSTIHAGWSYMCAGLVCLGSGTSGAWGEGLPARPSAEISNDLGPPPRQAVTGKPTRRNPQVHRVGPPDPSQTQAIHASGPLSFRKPRETHLAWRLLRVRPERRGSSGDVLFWRSFYRGWGTSPLQNPHDALDRVSFDAQAAGKTLA